MKRILVFVFFFQLFFSPEIYSIYTEKYVSNGAQANTFPLTVNKNTVPLIVNSEDFAGVLIAVENLQKDILAVTEKKVSLTNKLPSSGNVVIIGTLGKSPLIDQLIKAKKLDKSLLEGKKEKFIIQTISKPFKGIESALLIAGSDKRGTIYGIYDLSEQIGVSPWYYWADVPIKKLDNLYILPGTHTDGEPAVEYRGIFINDEAPALSGWIQQNFGSFNHQFYEKVFELILRLKGNFLWPAMWGRAFYDDDPENGTLADKYGVVIGTSHHEPMGRAHDEWRRYGKGAWNYAANPEVLDSFWKTGMERMKNYESIVTLAMRGDGDEPMSEESNIALLEKIVSNQRKIIGEVTGKPVEETPQVWALYKEVQEYYDKGMRVPDDVTLLLCDDNWGNVRKLPDLNAPARKGGYGMYYHFDYVGGPRNYKWLNTNQIQRVWEQMSLSYDYGVKKIWIVNVGDIKPMEYPIEFFLDLAWNPKKWMPENLSAHTRMWAEQQFGTRFATEIADFITRYTKYNSRRKPELLSPETYSLTNYNEADRIVNEYNNLAQEAEKIYNQLNPEYKDAYYQLVLFPVLACANLNEMYVNAGKNHLYAQYGSPETNVLAQKVKDLFEKDSILTHYYNHVMSDGKWNHMMDQTHIGYTYWQQPEKNVMPAVKTITPEDIKGSVPMFFEEPKKDRTEVMKKISSENIPEGTFVGFDNYVSIEAEHFSKAINTQDIFWKIIPDMGRTLSAVAAFPTTYSTLIPNGQSPRLEYNIYLFDVGEIEITLYFSPTLNFNDNKGLKYAISVNDENSQIININGKYTENQWNEWVANNINKITTKHRVEKTGLQTIRYWLVDPAVVLQKIVVNAGGLKPSYLGPMESERVKN